MTDDLRSVEVRERSVEELFDFILYKGVIPAVNKRFGVSYDDMNMSLRLLIAEKYLTWDKVDTFVQESDFDPLFSSGIELNDQTIGMFSRLLNKLNKELINDVAIAYYLLLALHERRVITKEEMDYFMKRDSKEVSPKNLLMQSIDLNNYFREKSERWAGSDWEYMIFSESGGLFSQSAPGHLVFDSSVLAYIGRTPEEVQAPTSEARKRVEDEMPEALDD